MKLMKTFWLDSWIQSNIIAVMKQSKSKPSITNENYFHFVDWLVCVAALPAGWPAPFAKSISPINSLSSIQQSKSISLWELIAAEWRKVRLMVDWMALLVLRGNVFIPFNTFPWAALPVSIHNSINQPIRKSWLKWIVELLNGLRLITLISQCLISWISLLFH